MLLWSSKVIIYTHTHKMHTIQTINTHKKFHLYYDSKAADNWGNWSVGRSSECHCWVYTLRKPEVFFFCKLFILQHCIGFAIHWLESAMGVHVFHILNHHPIPLGHPRAPALSTLSHASNLDWWIRFTYDNIHVSMPFSHIIPPSPSPTESKRLFNTYVSLLLSRIQGYRYHLSKFHIYALVYCIGVFLSGLLHSA